MTNWTSIASSADGTRLVAAASGEYPDYSGPVLVSRDFGSTWTSAGAPNTNWSSVASSADGTKLVAAVNIGGIYVSPDAGTNWMLTGVPADSWSAVASSASGEKRVQQSRGVRPGSAVASSASGEKLVAVSSGGRIYTSINAGATWEHATNAPFNQWNAAASSTDGTRLIAGGCWCGILQWGRNFLSTDSGATWMDTGVSSYYSSVASSVDGSKLIVANGSSTLASSADGAAWTALGSDGTFTSMDSGQTWSRTNAPAMYWKALASSADGGKVVAVAYGGGIWTLQFAPAPRLVITPADGHFVISWIAPSTSFVLQQNSDLNTTNWTDVIDVPMLNLTNLQHQVLIASSAGSRFYRLKH